LNNKTKANRIGNDSLDQLGTRIIDTVTKSDIPEAKVGKYFLILVEVFSRYHFAIEIGNEKHVREIVEAKYNERYAEFITVYDYIKGLLNAPDPEMKAAAVLLFEQLNKYGRNFSRVKLADQSSHYRLIFEALMRPEFTAAKTKTVLTNSVAVLNQLQLDYEDLYTGKGNNTATKTAPSNLRKEMENAIKMYLDELKWMTNSVDSPAWITLSSTIQQRFNEVSVSATRKKGDGNTVVNTSLSTTV